MSPSAILLAARFAALIPTRHWPRISATLVRHVWPLILTVTGGRRPEPRPATTSLGISTPVALPEGMTVALNFMCASSNRFAAPPAVPEGMSSPPRRRSDRLRRSKPGLRTQYRRREIRDGPAQPSTVDTRSFACQFRVTRDRQV